MVSRPMVPNGEPVSKLSAHTQRGSTLISKFEGIEFGRPFMHTVLSWSKMVYWAFDLI